MTTKWIGACRFSDSDDELDAYTQRKNAGLKTYEYLLPPDATGTEKFAVVSPSGRLTAGNLKIVKIVETRSVLEQNYEGDLKMVVAAFDTAGYAEETRKIERRRALLRQAEKMIGERSKIRQLEALAGDDPEVRALLDELKKV